MKSSYYYDYTRNTRDADIPEQTPSYYQGLFKGIEAHDVIDDFLLTYNVGTAVTYLLRAGKKPNNPKAQDIKKAILIFFEFL